MPLYTEVKESVRKLIERDGLKPGDRLPTEQELMRRFRVSRLTVIRAVRDLEMEGLIVRQQGRGTFVARSKVLVDLHRLKSFTEDMQVRDLRPGGRILEFSIVTSPPDITHALRLESPAPVLHILRLRFADDEPIGLNESYLARELTVPRNALERMGSLYALLWELHRVRLEEADETIEAVVAGVREAKLLGVPQGSALLRVERISYDQRQRPVELARMVYRGDRYQYFTRLRAG